MGDYGDSWSERAEIFEAQEWISSEDMKSLLRAWDRTNIAIAQSRQQAIDFFGSIYKDAPFKHDKRFPRYGSYVAINQGDWPAKIKQAMSSLQFKELDQTRAGKDKSESASRAQTGSGTAKSERHDLAEQKAETEPQASIPNDVILSFTNAIARMRAQLGTGDAVWSIKKFERDLSLEWRAAEP